MKTIKQTVLLGLALATAGAAATVPVANLSSSSSSERIATLERIMQQSQQRQLEVQRQLNSLIDEVNGLRGENEVHAHKLEQLVERQRELYQELEDRFSRFNTVQNQQSSTLNKPNTKVITQAVDTSNEPEVVYSGSISENEAYDRAMNLVLKERQYDKAIPEFRAFIKQFPNSGYTPNAYYWLGQLLFNKGNYVQAQKQFEQVINYYPDSNKRSDAMLKLGSIALKSNDSARAKVLFEKVISEYPSSTSAKLATSRLESLK